MSLASPAPKVENFSKAFDGLLQTLEPLLSQQLSHLSKRLQSGSSSSLAQPKAGGSAEATQNQRDEATQAANSQKEEQAAASESTTSQQSEREGKLDSARLYASTAYVLLDLCEIRTIEDVDNYFKVYLRLKGIDTASHPVMPELERVKAYFHKIKNAKNTETGEPRSNLDTAAANRFIKHSLSAANVASQLVQPSHKRFDFEKDEDEAPKQGEEQVAKASKKSQKKKETSTSMASEPTKETESTGSKSKRKSSEMDGKQSSTQKQETTGSTLRPSSTEAPAVNQASADEVSQDTSSMGPARKRPKVDPFAGSEEATPDLGNATAASDRPSLKEGKDEKPKQKKRSKKNRSSHATPDA